ncbi:antitoxin [Propionibacteriaceae bacterium Y1685]|uniref:antitoxin n=1 Tax=Microlunatus sp. Y1700 TaxID=3418487 RepID=UPI003B805EE2
MSELFNKGKDLAGEHSEQVSQGIDKGQDFVNEKTGGKYEEQVTQGGDFIEGQLGTGEGQQGEAPPPQ